MIKDNKLDDLFREKLRNHEQAPPAYLLENVLAGVAGERRKRKMFYWRIAGAAAILLFAFVAGWQLSKQGQQITNQPVVAKVQPALETTPETKKTVSAESHNNMTAAGTSQQASVKASSLAANELAKSKTEMTKIKRTAFGAENTSLVATGGPAPMKSMKNISGPIRQGEASSLQLRQQNVRSKSPEKSIDQQIMEQNQQAILAANSGKGESRWLVGAQVSPAYSVNRSSHSAQYASNMLNSSRSPVDLGGGILVEYKRGKRWSLQSGVYYSGLAQNSGNKSRSRNDYAFSDVSSNYFSTPVKITDSKMLMNSSVGVIELNRVPSGMVLGTNMEENSLVSAAMVSNVDLVQNFDYVEIPLYLRYTLIDARFDVEMLGGFSSNLLVGNQVFSENGSGRSLIGKTKDMEPVSYSGTFGLGLKYNLSKHLFLNVEPRIKYYLNSLNSNSSVSYKPYTIGVFTGISYEF